MDFGCAQPFLIILIIRVKKEATAWLPFCVDTWIRTKDPHHVKVIL